MMEPRHMTHEDFMALPEGTPAQLIGGMVVSEPGPAVSHQDAQNLIAHVLTRHVLAGNLGRILRAPTDVHLADDEVYQPDIFFIRADRFSREAAYIEGAPELVVEILSPPTAYYDLRHKMRATAMNTMSVPIFAKRSRSLPIDIREYGLHSIGLLIWVFILSSG